MRIAALTCRSFYSLLRGSVSVQRLIAKAAEYGYSGIAPADVNSLSGAADFWKQAEQAGIQPILGVEILTETEHAILLAEDDRGYKGICRIITARNLDPDFDLVIRLQGARGVICISDQLCLLEKLEHVVPEGYLFAGCRSKREVHFFKARGFSPVAWDQFTWLEEGDIETAKVLAKLRQLSTTGGGPPDRGTCSRLIPAREFARRFKGSPEAVSNAERILERCEFRLLRDHPILPKVAPVDGQSSDRRLAKLCHLGLARKYNPVSKEVVKRLEYELATVRASGFSDYFLVVERIVNFAKQQGIPVEVRGSAAGSLIAHVLGFTRVCPIENRLYFERFMNPGRTDCPDIDVDFCWRRRDEVIRFCYEHWGFEHVAMVCNINCYRLRGAIRDAARVLGFEPMQINELSRSRKIQRGSAIYQLAERLLDIPRHLGVHCGGIVVTPYPVQEVAPLQRATKGVIITQYDKDAAEAVGLVKIDLLGNRSLSTVHDAVYFVNQAGGSLDIDAASDPQDPKTARMLSAGDSLGVFQSESPGMRQLLRGLKVKGKKDLAIALSLIRPGPASGGMKAKFIERHVNGKPFTYLHPRMAELLGETHGVMLYQEDVMRIAVEVAGYTVAEADRFRSEVSKKVSPARLQAQYVDFVRYRAEKAGLDMESAEAIWDEILRFAAYSYCKAHATVYANIAWQTAYLKANYPQQFYCSLFNNHQGMYPLRVYVWDAKRHGLKILPPHVNHSDIEWSLEGKAIRAGLGLIKGLTYTTAKSILAERCIQPFNDLDDLRRRVRFRHPELQSLIHVGACDGLGPTRPVMLGRLQFAPAEAVQRMLFDVYNHSPLRKLPDYDRLARLRAEIDTMDIPFSLHPAVLLMTRYVPAVRLYRFLGRKVTVAGFIATARKAQTNDGRVMGFVTLEDSTGLAEVSFFPDQLPLYQEISHCGGPVWVNGKVTEHLSSLTVEGTTCGRV